MGAPIVLGYDGTDGARAALAEAIRIAKPLGAALTIAFAYAAPRVGGEITDLEATLRERGEALTAEAVDAARAAGVDAEPVLLLEKPGEGLAGLADRLDAQMIVVGSYGEKPLRGAIIGSTPPRLLHLSRRPVLVVRG
jgi:nucleotide-binding universal stress UspA family protein